MAYINKETGKHYDGGSITIYDDNALFSGIPTEEQLTKWGFTLMVVPHHEPSAEDLIRERMDEILSQLKDTDYIVLKKAEGIDISSYDEQYEGDFLAWRQSLRDEYNQLEQSLNN